MHSNNFGKCRAACGFSIGLYISLYIQYLQSNIIWIYIVTAKGSSMAILQTSFVLLKVILMMQIKIICWNGRGIWATRECWVTREATTSRCVGAYMSMAMLACMQLVTIKSWVRSYCMYLSLIPAIQGNVLIKHQVQIIVSLFIYSWSIFFPTTQFGILQNDNVHYENVQFNYIQIHY